jgi:hypothetical protein
MVEVRVRPLRAKIEEFVATGEISRPPGLSVTLAAAVCLIGYSYLGGLWLNRHGYSPSMLVLIRSWVNQPTGIGEDFGQLGVALLLLAAGFSIIAAAGRSRRALGVTLLGWYPLVASAVLLSALLITLGAEPLTEPDRVPIGLSEVLGNLLLVNRLFDQPSLVGLDSPVVATALFGLLVLVLLPLLHRLPGLAVLIQLEIACVLVLAGGWATEAGTHVLLQQLGMLAGLLPLLVLGELGWLVRARRLPTPHGGALGLGSLALLVVADRLFSEFAGYWRPLSSVYALLLFVIALPWSGAIARALPVRWLASRALPLFLSTVVVGYATLGMQYLVVPLPVALLLALMITCASAEMLHRWVALPSRRFTGRTA